MIFVQLQSTTGGGNQFNTGTTSAGDFGATNTYGMSALHNQVGFISLSLSLEFFVTLFVFHFALALFSFYMLILFWAACDLCYDACSLFFFILQLELWSHHIGRVFAKVVT